MTREEKAAADKRYYAANKERIRARKKEYRAANRERIYAQQKAWCTAHKERLSLEAKSRYRVKQERLLGQLEEVRAAYKQKRADYARRYYQKNIVAMREKQRKYRRRRRRDCAGLMVCDLLRTRIRHALFGRDKDKKSRTMELVGCSIKELMAHIESKFSPGMSWDNCGKIGWHIDHIRPCAAFDLTDPEQQKRCFHYSNLQPLWAKDNLSKSDKLDWKPQPVCEDPLCYI